MTDCNTTIIEEFRADGGRAGGMREGTTLVLLRHIGARSGIGRVRPVACSARGRGRFAIWAANGGAPARPGWYHNRKADPQVIVEAGHQTVTVLAREPDAAVRSGLWPELVARWPKPAAGSPGLGAAQAKTARQFPVFMLTPGLTRRGRAVVSALRTGAGQRRSSRGPVTAVLSAGAAGLAAQLNRRLP
jgi:deazaflavin-dependent oxidoreductase (nitroreductase family)